jgi:hypothetical protein
MCQRMAASAIFFGALSFALAACSGGGALGAADGGTSDGAVDASAVSIDGVTRGTRRSMPRATEA